MLRRGVRASPSVVDTTGMPLLTYQQVLERLGNGRVHLLLGNGFSIECDPVFAYPSLYQKAVESGLSERAQRVFEGLGTNNFEGVMRLLSDSHWVARTYGLVEGDTSDMLADLEVVKRALVQAVTGAHLPHTGAVDAERKAAAAKFFKPYHNVFTTNYDLLAYWVVLHDGRPRYKDGFAEDPEDPDAPHVVFAFHVGNERGLYYLHGGLHLFAQQGLVTKHCWNRAGVPLTTSIQAGLAEGRYPLFVAEGLPEKKLEQINRSSYLSYAFGKFMRIEGPLVVFGSSLGATDSHLVDALAGNRGLRQLYLSVQGAANEPAADAIVARVQAVRNARGFTPLQVDYYDSASARVWGN